MRWLAFPQIGRVVHWALHFLLIVLKSWLEHFERIHPEVSVLGEEITNEGQLHFWTSGFR